MQRYKYFDIGDVDGYDETGMGPCDDGDWVQYSDAQAKIDKLKKRISDMAITNVRSRIKSMQNRAIERDRDHDDFMNLVEQWETSHNDAIEAAAAKAESHPMRFAGMNEEFVRNEMSAAIRALKK